MTKDRTELLLHEPHLYRAFSVLALPIFAANFVRALNDLVDTYFIGQITDSVAAQAGISISWPLLNILMSLQIGFSVAGVAVISQLLGAGKRERARDNAGLLLVIAVVLGIVVNIILWFFSPTVMRWMGAEAGVLQSATDYLRIRSFEMVPLFVFGAFQAIRQAQGDTTTPVALSMVAVAINIVFTGIFVRVFDMGAYGAGLATMMGQAAIAPVCLYLIFTRRAPLPVGRENLRVTREPLFIMLKIAAPSAGSQAFSSLGFLVLQSLILSYGDETAAAFSIGNKISNMLLMPISALGSVLAAYVGQNIGAGNGERARQSYKVSRNLSLILSVVGCAALFPVKSWLVGLLTNDALTHTLGTEYVLWVLITQPLMALFQNYLSTFNGSGNTRYSLAMSTARLWAVRLPLILAFRRFTSFGSSGIWYAMVISNFIIVILGAWFYRKVDFTPYKGLAGEA